MLSVGGLTRLIITFGHVFLSRSENVGPCANGKNAGFAKGRYGIAAQGRGYRKGCGAEDVKVFTSDDFVTVRYHCEEMFTTIGIDLIGPSLAEKVNELRDAFLDGLKNGIIYMDYSQFGDLTVEVRVNPADESRIRLYG